MMNVSRCKMCGGAIEYEPGTSVAVCDSCGTKQTMPKFVDERITNLYDRANHYRRNNEFDKAEDVYNQILNENRTDAEAYWSLVLCNYGIEYVEDARTHKRVPTVNRAQYTSIYMDENYKEAIRYADSLQRDIYESEAAEIDRIQKGILAISEREEPFDVFICYKESDDSGRRTRDSVYANDIYYQMQNEGLKVFFARITLEDKLGTEYEPYIFAALNSAKVMIVVGTRPDYFNSPWVKNEWKRYLALVQRSGGMKALIPVYRDMNPYDLPEEFSHLQALDMGQLGFLQDLVHGVKKIIGATAKEAYRAQDDWNLAQGYDQIRPVPKNEDPRLMRAFIFIEDGYFDKAEDYLEQVLDEDPENASAYLGKLMITLKAQSREKLGNYQYMFEEDRDCQKVLRFGDETLVNEMNGYIANARAKYGNSRMLPNELKAIASKSQKENKENKQKDESINGVAYGAATSSMSRNSINSQTYDKNSWNQIPNQEQIQRQSYGTHTSSESGWNSQVNGQNANQIFRQPTVKREDYGYLTNSSFSTKSRSTAMALCVLSLFGFGGLHRFYVGKNGTGLLHLCTLGFYWIGTLIDLLAIYNGNFTDSEGKLLR